MSGVERRRAEQIVVVDVARVVGFERKKLLVSRLGGLRAGARDHRAPLLAIAERGCVRGEQWPLRAREQQRGSERQTTCVASRHSGSLPDGPELYNLGGGA